MWTGVAVQTAPTGELISVSDMKARLRVDFSDDDALITALINGAVREIDGPHGIGVAMMAQTWRKTMDCFPSVITLPGWPVKSVSAVTYLDADGAEQTVNASDYRLTTGSEPARLTPAYGQSWPRTRNVTGAVWVDYLLGESNSAHVPADLIDAVGLMVGHRYEHREAVVAGVTVSSLPMGVDSILARYRRGFAA